MVDTWGTYLCTNCLWCPQKKSWTASVPWKLRISGLYKKTRSASWESRISGLKTRTAPKKSQISDLWKNHEQFMPPENHRGPDLKKKIKTGHWSPKISTASHLWRRHRQECVPYEAIKFVALTTKWTCTLPKRRSRRSLCLMYAVLYLLF